MLHEHGVNRILENLVAALDPPDISRRVCCKGGGISTATAFLRRRKGGLEYAGMQHRGE